MGDWRLNVQCRVNEEQNLVSVMRQLHQAVLDCIDRKQVLPGLALMYATIDILASLERPADQEATGSKEFKQWVENYMPLSVLNVTSDDLWAARCGLLHTFTPSSDKSRAGKARELHYVRGNANFVPFAQREVDPSCSTKIVVDIDCLVESFQNGIMAFMQEIIINPQKKTLTLQHSKKLFIHENYPKPNKFFNFVSWFTRSFLKTK